MGFKIESQLEVCFMIKEPIQTKMFSLDKKEYSKIKKNCLIKQLPLP